MMLLFLEECSFVFRSFVMKEVDVSLFCNAKRTDLESK